MAHRWVIAQQGGYPYCFPFVLAQNIEECCERCLSETCGGMLLIEEGRYGVFSQSCLPLYDRLFCTHQLVRQGNAHRWGICWNRARERNRSDLDRWYGVVLIRMPWRRKPLQQLCYPTVEEPAELPERAEVVASAVPLVQRCNRRGRDPRRLCEHPSAHWNAPGGFGSLHKRFQAEVQSSMIRLPLAAHQTITLLVFPLVVRSIAERSTRDKWCSFP